MGQKFLFFQMYTSRKTTLVVLIVFIFVCFVKNDYFAGLAINQTLIDRANKAMDHLKAKLEKNFDCDDGEEEAAKEDAKRLVKPPAIVVNDDSEYEKGNLRKERRGPSNEMDWSKRGESTRHQNEESYQQHSLRYHKHSRRASLKTFKSNFNKNNDKTGFTFFEPLQKGILQMISPQQRKDLYNASKIVNELLGEIKAYLVQYNNVIIGSNNSVSGNSNVVIGSRNSLTGNNYWVFDSGVTTNSTEDGVLIIQSYLIELLDIPDILTKPHDVIRCIHQKDSDDRFKTWWNSAPPQFKMSL